MTNIRERIMGESQTIKVEKKGKPPEEYKYKISVSNPRIETIVLKMITLQELKLERLGDPGQKNRPQDRPTYRINYQIAKDVAKIRESAQDFTIYRRLSDTVMWQVWKENTGQSFAEFTEAPFVNYKKEK